MLPAIINSVIFIYSLNCLQYRLGLALPRKRKHITPFYSISNPSEKVIFVDDENYAAEHEKI